MQDRSSCNWERQYHATRQQNIRALSPNYSTRRVIGSCAIASAIMLTTTTHVLLGWRNGTIFLASRESTAFHALTPPAQAELHLSSKSTIPDGATIIKVLTISHVQNSLAFLLRHLLLLLCLIQSACTSVASILARSSKYTRTHHGRIDY